MYIRWGGNLIYGQTNHNQTFNKQVKFYDRYGNAYKANQIQMPALSFDMPPPACNPTPNPIFNIVYKDVIEGLDQGFSDATLGQARQAVVCQVFRDLANLIVPTTTTGADKVRIEIRTDDDLPAGVEGAASPYFQINNFFSEGIVYGEVWKTINGGVNSYTDLDLIDPDFIPSNAYHGYINISFPEPGQNYHLEYDDASIVTTTLPDLYRIVLHEAIHLLGFVSLIDSNGESVLADEGMPFAFSKYDTYLENVDNTGTATPLIINNCNTTTFNPIVDPGMLYSACNSIVFNGINNTNDIVFSPTGWLGGSSLSHFECQPADGSLCSASYDPLDNVMTYCGGFGPDWLHQRNPGAEEVLTLCDLGYSLNTEYGFASDGITTTYRNDYTTCTPPCLPTGVNDFETLTATNDMITINILENDNSASSYDCLKILWGEGSITNETPTSFTYNQLPSYSGLVILSYVPICEGNVGNTTTIYIDVQAPPLPICAPNPCNLICNGDFENLTDQHAMPLSDFFISAGNTPDLYPVWSDVGFVCNGSIATPLPHSLGDLPNVQYIAISNSNANTEGLFYQLSEPLQVGTTYTLSFYATSACPPLETNFLFSENAPCVGTGVNLGTLDLTTGIECDATNPGIDYIAAQTENVSINTPVLGQWDYYSIDFTPTAPNLEYLTIYLTPQSGGAFGMFDDFAIVPQSETTLEITATPASSFPCIGDEMQIDYLVCLDEAAPTNPYNVDLTVTLPNGFNINTAADPLSTFNSTGQGSISFEGTLCKPFTLFLTVDNTAALAAQDIELNIENDNICTTTGNNTHTLQVQPGIDILEISKAVVGGNAVDATETITFEITVTNTSTTTTVNNIVVQDVFGPEFNLLTFDSEGTGGILDLEFLTIGFPIAQSPSFSLAPSSQKVLTFSIALNLPLPTDCATVPNCVTIISANGACNLPKQACTDLIINAPTFATFTAGQFDPSSSNLDCVPLNNDVWSIGNHPLGTAAGTVSDPIRINGDLQIVNGVNITINGLVFDFGPEGRIQVGSFSTLNLNNCLLRGDMNCGTMWQGIQTFTQPDFWNSSTFPNLNINTCLIKDAIVGVISARINTISFNSINEAISDNPDLDMYNTAPYILNELFDDPTISQSGGGNIDIQHSTFDGCFQGINICSGKGNKNIFNNIFTATGNLVSPFTGYIQNPEAGIVVFDTKLASIADCTFNNMRYGIRITNSSSLINNCTFNGSQIGISAQSILNQNITVDDNTFEACKIAVQGDGLALTLRNNQINTLQNDASYQTIAPSTILYATDVGVLLRGSTFDIDQTENNERNIIENCNYGMVLIENDQEGGNIKNTTIDETNIPIFALGDNTGVDITCNDFLNYHWTAIMLMDYGSTGQLRNLGTCSDDFLDEEQMPAANLFVPATSLFLSTDIYSVGSTSTTLWAYSDIPTVTSALSIDGIGSFNDCNFSTAGAYNRDTYCGITQLVNIVDIPSIVSVPIRNTHTLNWINKYKKEANFTAAHNLLNTVDTRMSKRLASDLRLQKNELQEAEDKLNSIDKNTLEDENFDYVHRLVIDLRRNDKTVRDINGEQENKLMTIAQSKTKSAYKAQALLYSAKGIEFPFELPKLDFIDGSENIYTVFKNQNNTNFSKLSQSLLYPNPAKNNATLNYQLEHNEQAQLIIYNINGKELATYILNNNSATIDLRTYPTGVYIYKLIADNKIIAREKLVVIK